MSEKTITASAQMLAEDNNVDWRLLQGTGEGGIITEEDVVMYLAMVNVGEAPVNPTAEPLPEGLTAWPEELQGRPPQTPLSNQFQKADEAPQLAETPQESGWDFSAPAATPPEAPAAVPAETGGFAFSSEAAAPEAAVPEATVPEAAEAGFTAAGGAEPFAVDSGSSQPVQEPDPVSPFASAAVSPAEAPKEAPANAVSAADYQQLLRELAVLKQDVSDLSEERDGLRSEVALRQQEADQAAGLRQEVATLRQRLEEYERLAGRAAELEAHNQELEDRLERARAFKRGAKAEFHRVLADNMMLEQELSDISNRSTRLTLFG